MIQSLSYGSTHFANQLVLCLKDTLEKGQRIFKWLIHYRQDNRLTAIAHLYTQQLMALEKVSILSDSGSALTRQASAHLKQMQNCYHQHAKGAKQQLERSILAQSYRTNKAVENSLEEIENLEALKIEAKEWKITHSYYQQKELSQAELNALNEACQYQKFAEFLVTDDKTQAEFFSWILPNDNPIHPFKGNQVPIFIKFPGLYQEIVRDLGSRSARYGAKLFKIDPATQLLTIKIEGKRVKIEEATRSAKLSLIGPDKKGQMSLTLAQIFAEFKHRMDTGYGNVEVYGKQGLCNYNAAERGAYCEEHKNYASLDVDDPQWFNQMVPQEILTKAESQTRFGIDFSQKEEGDYSGCLSGTYPIFLYLATQVTPGNIRGTHSYYGFLTVYRAEDRVELRTMGQFVYPFPRGLWQNFTFVSTFHPSRLFCLDENSWVAERNHTAKVIYPSREKWKDFLASLAKTVKRGDQKKLGFHLAHANCTTHSSKKIKRHFPGQIPDLKINFWNLNPNGAEGALFHTLKKLPPMLAKQSLASIHFIFGSWRKMAIAHKNRPEEIVSMFNQPPYFDGIALHHPGPLFLSKNPKN